MVVRNESSSAVAVAAYADAAATDGRPRDSSPERRRGELVCDGADCVGEDKGEEQRDGTGVACQVPCEEMRRRGSSHVERVEWC